MKRIKADWYDKSWSEEDKANFKESLIAAKPIFDRMEKILESRMDSGRKSARDRANFKVENWAYLQADYNATERTYQNIIDLITIRDEV